MIASLEGYAHIVNMLIDNSAHVNLQDEVRWLYGVVSVSSCDNIVQLKFNSVMIIICINVTEGYDCTVSCMLGRPRRDCGDSPQE